MTVQNNSPINNDELVARGLIELERRKRLDPMAFYEPASDKSLAFHKSRATTRLLIGANRSSKTETSMQEVLWLIKGNHPFTQRDWKYPIYGRIVVPDFNNVEKVINEKFRKMCPTSLLRGGSWEKAYNSRTHIIDFSNGCKIDIMTHEQPVLAFEGASRHFTLFDEEPPEDIYISCLLRHTDVRGITMMSFTPLNGMSWTYGKLYLRSYTDPNVVAWTMSIYDNKFLTQSAIDEVEALVVDEIDREIRLFGMYKSRAGLVFGNFDPKVHIYDPYSDESYYDWWDGYYPPAEWPHGIGIDPGWGHPTGVIWGAIDPDTGDRYFYSEHKESEMLPEDHAEIIHTMNNGMGVYAPIYVIDSQAKATDQKGGSVWQDYKDAGIIARLATKKLHEGNIQLARLMRVMSDGFGNKRTQFHVSKECTQFIEEIGEYQRRQSTDIKQQDQYVDKKNDLISAARYINWEFSRLDIESYLEDRQRQIEARLLSKRLNPLGRQIDNDNNQRQGAPFSGY